MNYIFKTYWLILFADHISKSLRGFIEYFNIQTRPAVHQNQYKLSYKHLSQPFYCSNKLIQHQKEINQDKDQEDPYSSRCQIGVF